VASAVFASQKVLCTWLKTEHTEHSSQLNSREKVHKDFGTYCDAKTMLK
jgi:hypothetical protein